MIGGSRNCCARRRGRRRESGGEASNHPSIRSDSAGSSHHRGIGGPCRATRKGRSGADSERSGARQCNVEGETGGLSCCVGHGDLNRGCRRGTGRRSEPRGGVRKYRRCLCRWRTGNGQRLCVCAYCGFQPRWQTGHIPLERSLAARNHYLAAVAGIHHGGCTGRSKGARRGQGGRRVFGASTAACQDCYKGK